MKKNSRDNTDALLEMLALLQEILYEMDVTSGSPTVMAHIGSHEEPDTVTVAEPLAGQFVELLELFDEYIETSEGGVIEFLEDNDDN